MKAFSVEHVAMVCHEANRAYCVGLGDNSQVPWEEAADWQRNSAMNGAVATVCGEANSAEDQHRLWMADKEADGWVYGEEKDADKKTHPCMVPYDQLPSEQRIKDKLFRAIVIAMMTIGKESGGGEMTPPEGMMG